MKKNQEKIMSLLRQNGRIKLTELSKKAQLPVSTIHENITRQVKEGTIKPSLLIKFNKIGYNASAHILLEIDPQDKEETINHLKNNRHVNSLYRINNGWNIIMECVFKDMFELEEFMESLESKYKIKQKQVHYTLNELKREGFLSQPEMA